MQTQALAKLPSPRYPQPVEIVETCRDCGGEGCFEIITGGWELPRTKEIACNGCNGTGEIRPRCDFCHGEGATTTFFDGKWELHYCEGCATITDGLWGEDLVIALMLGVMQGPGSIEDISAEELR